MAGLEAARVSASALPIIDIGRLVSPNRADREAVAAQMRAACLRSGFFYICNHRIPGALIDAAFARTRALFALPPAAKSALDKAHSRANRGYEPLGGQTLESGAPPDLKEGFYIGRETAPDDPRAAKFNHGPNQWPDGMPEFRSVMEEYREQMTALGQRLFRCLALSLDLPENYFEAFCANPFVTVRLLHYPPQEPNPAPGELGCGAHTDFGALTLLYQDEVGGLQVHMPDRGWIEAPPIPGTYVVNLGDMIARWTNDRYRSTLHRVVNRSGRDRYSVPFFYSGNPEHLVECIPTCRRSDEAPHYPPITVAGHIAERYRQPGFIGARPA